MNIFKKISLSLATVAGAMLGANAANVIMTTPMSFRVLSVSPNAKWACGVFIDGYMQTTGFRWNLESDSFEMLGPGYTTAADVANDGTVSGDFNDSESFPGYTVTMPGYWRNGSWHSLELPAGNIVGGFGYGISTDGQYMIGNIEFENFHFAPYIWKNGKFYRDLTTGNVAVGVAVSPDASMATGFTQVYNRISCLWNPDNSVRTFEEAGPEQCSNPFTYGRNFSPDGSKLVYYGGWIQDAMENPRVYAYYDTVTDEVKSILIGDPSWDHDVNDISNSGKIVGQIQRHGCIWIDGNPVNIEVYLKEQGVDLYSFDGFYEGQATGDESEDVVNEWVINEPSVIDENRTLPISNVIALSEDEKTFALLYYDKLGQERSMIVKIDYDFTHATPAELTAQQLSGINAVGIEWKKPYGLDAVKGYNVYRNGNKISGFLPITTTYFIDKNLEEGEYTYEVGLVTLAGVETKCEAVNVDVKGHVLESPRSIFARQKGVNGGVMEWEAPFSNAVHLRYFHPDAADFSGFSIYQVPMDIEMAVRYKASNLSAYSGYEISEVTFYPLSEKEGWTINIYAMNNDGSLDLLASQEVDQDLKYGHPNRVKLASPVALPAGKDIVAAIETVIKVEGESILGAEQGNAIAGYSDLLRNSKEDSFFSMMESSLGSGLYIEEHAWAIDLGLTHPSGTIAEPDSYNVYLDGDLYENTDKLGIEFPNLSEGQRTISVSAVYGEQESKLVDTTLEIKTNYPAVTGVRLSRSDDQSTVINAEWDFPVNNDLSTVSYSSQSNNYSMGIRGNESTAYALMIAGRYPASMLRSYGGYVVDSFRFYPLTDAIFTIMLYEDGDLVHEQEIYDYNVGAWNTVKADELITLKSDKEYMLVLDCFDPVPDVPLVPIDNTRPVEGYSDIYSLDGGATWESLTLESGTHGCWMLGMRIAAPEEGEDMDVSGFDFVVDSKVRNSAPFRETTYSYDFGKLDTKKHSVRVNVYYKKLDKSVNGETSFFYLATSGVDINEVAAITLNQGANYLVAEGDGVESIDVYALTGSRMASAKGNTVGIDNLGAGVYVVRVNAGENTITRKVSIIR